MFGQRALKQVYSSRAQEKYLTSLLDKEDFLCSAYAKHQKSCWPRWKVTERLKVKPDETELSIHVKAGGRGHTDPINWTLSLHFPHFQFTKSSTQTLNVCNANVETSLTHIKSSQGHCQCALLLAWDQTGPIKCDLKQWSSCVNSLHKSMIFETPTNWGLICNIEQWHRNVRSFFHAVQKFTLSSILAF